MCVFQRFFQVFVVIFIAVGLFMFTFQSTQFNLEGFIMVMSASVLSGLRWTLAQIVLQKNEIGQCDQYEWERKERDREKESSFVYNFVLKFINVHYAL